MAYFTKEFLQFFMELAPNNNKDWFDENRSTYENFVREPFKKFVDHLITEMAKINPQLKDLENKNCIFRINRDIRFSKDKTPYKTQVSAAIIEGGKKNYAGEGVYFEMGPEHLRVYGGLYELDKDSLLLVREGISSHLTEFKKLYQDPKFEKTYGHIRGDQNKILPKELKEFGEAENLLFNKQFYFYAEFAPETILDKNLDKTILEAYQAGRPLQHFLGQFLK